MTSAPKDIVEAGYDRIADRYLAWIDEIQGDPRLRFLRGLMTRLPAHPRVLDLGCGAGIPCTARLAEQGDVMGVDLSSSQIELARHKVPNARFVKADMITIELPLASFDAVTAFYSIAHVPRDQHRVVFHRIAEWLRPGGYFLAALGCGASRGTVENWLGAPMFFSSHDARTNRSLLIEAGFTVIVDENVTMHEPEGPATFQWVIATKPDRAGITDSERNS
ncbi:MAG TPA: methyltransferase domain-containing protein [Pseudonocardiaceae bacterium]|nr:methyltransferase domain-containing protein [Pseudonocardiaceae bacterium]